MDNTNTSSRNRRSKRKTKKKKSNLTSRMSSSLLVKGNGDFWLVLFVAMLVIFGLIMVFSSSYYYSISKEAGPYYYLIRQAMWIITGGILFVIAASVDYHKYMKPVTGYIAAAVGLMMLLLVMTPLGTTINDSTRWISLGGLTIMPGEFAKLFAIIFTACYLSYRPERIKYIMGDKPFGLDSICRGWLIVILVGGIYAALIYKQPNLSTAITVVGIVGCMLIVAGLRKEWVMFFGGVGIAAIGFFVTFMKDTYQYQRLVSFLDPFADPLGNGYQVVQSLLAMGSGGLTGVGLGKSVQKSLYLPEPQNDFILAIIGEELGFLGIAALLIVYCLLIWRGVHIAINAKDLLGMLLASGVVLMIGIQVILNVAVVTSSMPPTGINLPFISYGGNGMWIFMFSAGLLVNISRQLGTSNSRLETRNE